MFGLQEFPLTASSTLSLFGLMTKNKFPCTLLLHYFKYWESSLKESKESILDIPKGIGVQIAENEA